MQIFTRSKLMIFGILLMILGAYLSGWFDMIRDLMDGSYQFDTTRWAIGSVLLATGPWIIRSSRLFGKGGN